MVRCIGRDWGEKHRNGSGGKYGSFQRFVSVCPTSLKVCGVVLFYVVFLNQLLYIATHSSLYLL
jgi:hypothetical protein